MINSRRVLAVITARGGSKGLPGKNVRPLHGKPLITWTIEAALTSQAIDRVIVSTDSPEIREVALGDGAEVPFLRPADLSGDLAKQEDAVLHAMAWAEDAGDTFGYIVMLAPTNPLRDGAEIDRSVDALISQPAARAAMTVVECEHTPLFANVLPPDGSMRDFVPRELRTKNRQEMPIYYRICGSVCVAEWDYFREHGSFLAEQTYAVVTSGRQGVDVDRMIDFLVAEAYLANPQLD